MKYIDTSVIVSALDPLDPSSKKSYDFLSKNEEKVASELVLVELTSVLSRNSALRQLEDKFKNSGESNTFAAIRYILERFSITYRPLIGQQVNTPAGRYWSIISFAMTNAHKLPLRTLDLLHVSYAYALGREIKSLVVLVTKDSEFFEFADQIKEITDIEVMYLK